MDKQENEWQRHIDKEFFQNSLVEIIYSQDRKAIGCFVTPNEILTCLHPFEGIDIERLKVVSIDGERRSYEILGAAAHQREYPDIDLLLLQVKVEHYRERACIELDLEADERSSDEFCIYDLSTSLHAAMPKVSISGSQPSEKLEFSSTDLKIVSFIGCPVINRRTGKVCGIVSKLDKVSATLSGQAIPVSRIITRLPDTRAGNHYATNVLCNLPERGQQGLIGRKDELQALFKYLSPQHAQHIVEINGKGGMGKTELAVTAASICIASYRRVRAKSSIPIFDAVVFISLENNNHTAKEDYPATGLLRILGTIGDTLKIPNFDLYAEAENFDRVYEALSRKTTLLILDGWDDSIDADRIWDFLDNVPYPTKVIITARERKSSYSCISLKPLMRAESSDFILHQAAMKNQKLEESEVAIILDSVPGVPILLTQGIDRFHAGKYEEERDIDLAEASDPAIFDIDRSIDSIVSTNADAAAILQVLSFFVTPATMEATVEISSKLLVSKQGLELEKSLELLEQLGLMLKLKSGEKKRYGLLKNVRECVLDRPYYLLDEAQSGEARSRWVQWYCNFVFSHSIDELEDEWENIKEVLVWCENKRDFNSIKAIWLSLDKLVERKQDWAIRLYWWEYLYDAFSQRNETLLQMEALLALVDTCLEVGNKQLAEKYFDKASNLLEDEKYDLSKASNITKRKRYVETLAEMQGRLEPIPIAVA